MCVRVVVTFLLLTGCASQTIAAGACGEHSPRLEGGRVAASGNRPRPPPRPRSGLDRSTRRPARSMAQRGSKWVASDKPSEAQPTMD